MTDDREPQRQRRRQRRDGPPPPPKPLDARKLQDLALHYAARYATTAARLRAYLQRKLRERPWEGDTPPDTAALIDRLVSLGYVNDAAWASMKRREMRARGLGPRRVAQALAAAGVADTPPDDNPFDDAPTEGPTAAAVRFARRKRLGPFARTASTDPATTRRATAAMLRAGHSFDITRRVLAAPDEAAAEALTDD